MNYLLIAAIMLVILFLQLPSLILYESKWDLAVFVFFWLSATGYSFLVAAGITALNPSKIMLQILDLVKSLI